MTELCTYLLSLYCRLTLDVNDSAYFTRELIEIQGCLVSHKSVLIAGSPLNLPSRTLTLTVKHSAASTNEGSPWMYGICMFVC